MTTEFKDSLNCMMDRSCWVSENYATIRCALLIAHKLMQEPSKSVVSEGVEMREAGGGCTDIFKAMRDQMLKEAEAR